MTSWLDLRFLISEERNTYISGSGHFPKVWACLHLMPRSVVVHSPKDGAATAIASASDSGTGPFPEKWRPFSEQNAFCKWCPRISHPGINFLDCSRVHVCTHSHSHTHTCTHILLHSHTLTRIHTLTFTHTFTHTLTHSHTQTPPHTHTHIYIHSHIFHSHSHTYTHTYTHTLSHSHTSASHTLTHS